MGQIIVIEGIDASGKTTVAECLCKEMQRRGVDCIHLSKKNPAFSDKTDPQIIKYADTLRKMVWSEEIDGNSLAFLNQLGWTFQLALWYAFLRENYINVESSKHEMIVVDGWFYKLYARMRQNKNANLNLLSNIMQELVIGDKVFLLHEKTEICYIRRNSFKNTELGGYGEELLSDAKDAFVTFQENVQSVLEKLAEENKWSIIECNRRTAEEIAMAIAEDINKEGEHI